MMKYRKLIQRKIKDFYQDYTLEFWGIILAVFLLIIPLFWKKHIEFDLANFTAEWYKTILVYLGIGVIVVLYTDKNKEKKKKRLIKKRKNIAENIKNKPYKEYNSDIVSYFNNFLDITQEIETLYNSTYLNDNENIAKKEMEYYVKNSSKINNCKDDYDIILNNVKQSL